MTMMMKEAVDPQVTAARVRARVRVGAEMRMKVLLHVAIVLLPAAQAEVIPAIHAAALPACPKKKYAA
jgi:hypothetical protein